MDEDRSVIAAREALHARGLPADDMGDAAALAACAALEAPKVVYLVSDGSDSDYYHVEGIFSTRAGAQGYIDRAGPGDRLDIEEYTLDEMVGWEVGPTWDCSIDLDDGMTFAEYRRPRGTMRHPAAVEYHDMPALRSGHPCLRVTSPISADHARKAAVEKRQQWLRARALTGA